MKLLNTPPAKILFPKISTLQEKLLQIHLYDDDWIGQTEQVGSDIENHVEAYKEAIDKLINLQNRFQEKKQEIKDIKQLAEAIEQKTVYTEKLTNIIDDFCQDANLDQLQTDYKDARREVSKYRNIFSICKTTDALNRYMCFVCVEATVDHCLVPCGHVLCSSCAAKIKTNCPFCRAAFMNKVKMYLD